MKVLIINGSPHEHGTTSCAVEELENEFKKNGIDTEVVRVGDLAVHGCINCRKCKEIHKCIYDDVVNVLAQKLLTAEGLILASPVYYAAPNGTLISILDRLFFSFQSQYDGSYCEKVGASVVVARRAGTTNAFNVLNNYLTHHGFTMANGQYWNAVFGTSYDEAKLDSEGLQQMRTLADNMTFLMKSIKEGSEKYGLPIREKPIKTNFI